MSDTIWSMVDRDEHGVSQIQLNTVTFRDPESGLYWWTVMEWRKYQVTFSRTTCPRSSNWYPRTVDGVTLIDQTRDLLAQPKDWGTRRLEHWKRSRAWTGGCVSATDPLDWSDIKGLREWFAQFQAMVKTAVDEGEEFNPLIDWLSESDSIVQPLYTRCGVLP